MLPLSHTVRQQVLNCLIEDLLQASKHTLLSIEWCKSFTDTCGKISLNKLYGNRLLDAPLSSLTCTVVLFPPLLLTITSVRRHWSFLSLETSSKAMFALWVYLTLVVKCTVMTIYSIIFMHCKWIISLSTFMHVLTCFPTTTSSTLWLVLWVSFAEFLEVIGFLHLKHSFPKAGHFLGRWLLPQFLHLPCPLPPLWLELRLNLCPCHHSCFGFAFRSVHLIDVSSLWSVHIL